MEIGRTHKLIQAQQIHLFQNHKSHRRVNPEESATERLIEISNEQLDFDAIQREYYTDFRQSKQSELSGKEGRATSPTRSHEGRLPVSQNFTKSHKMWRKSSVNCISGEQVCVMRKERVLNLSNFLILQNDNPNNDCSDQVAVNSENQFNKTTYKLRPSKNIMNFIRKRNLPFFKEQNIQKEECKVNPAQTNLPSTKRSVSPTIQRMNMSCELPRYEQNQNQIKIMASSKLQNSAFVEFRCTNTNFRNKKLNNYLRYRMGNKP